MRDAIPPTRAHYRHFLRIPTRWMDNDRYGHVNNVVYYSYFDTAVNEHLIREGGLDIDLDPVVAYVVETACRFHRPVAFPDTVEAGLAVRRLGRSSVAYDVAIFAGAVDAPAASGRFVHVWVDRVAGRPAPIPDRIRRALLPLVVVGEA
jgi:acyl-CoA thioester hydrolase